MFASERGRRVVGVVRPRARSDDELTRRVVYVEVHNIVNVCSKGFNGTPLCMTVKAAGEAWAVRAYCVLGLEKRDVSSSSCEKCGLPHQLGRCFAVSTIFSPCSWVAADYGPFPCSVHVSVHAFPFFRTRFNLCDQHLRTSG